MKQVKLDDILTIKVGTQSKLEVDEQSGYVVSVNLLTGKNITDLGVLDLSNNELKQAYIKERREKDSSEDILKAEDIVLQAKGTNLRAALVSKQDEESSLIASPSNFILGVNKELVLPEVIVAYFNSEYGQQVLDSLNMGTGIKHVPAKRLKEIEITLPSIEKQSKIAEIFHQNIKVLRAIEALQAQQQKTMNAAIQQLMDKE